MFCFCSRDDAAQDMPEVRKTWPVPKISETLRTENTQEQPATRARRSHATLTPEHKFDSEKEIEY